MSRQLEQTDQLYKSGMVQKKRAERLGIAEGDGNLSPAKIQRNLPHQKSALASGKSKPKKNKFPTKKIRSQMAQNGLREREKGR